MLPVAREGFGVQLKKQLIYSYNPHLACGISSAVQLIQTYNGILSYLPIFFSNIIHTLYVDRFQATT